MYKRHKIEGEPSLPSQNNGTPVVNIKYLNESDMDESRMEGENVKPAIFSREPKFSSHTYWKANPHVSRGCSDSTKDYKKSDHVIKEGLLKALWHQFIAKWIRWINRFSLFQDQMNLEALVREKRFESPNLLSIMWDV